MLASSTSMSIAIDIIGILLLWMIRFDFGILRQKIKGTDDRLFYTMLLVNRWLLYCDILAWILNGRIGSGFRPLLCIFNVIYYTLHPLMAVIWIVYCVYQINKYFISPKSLFGVLLLTPVAIIFVLSVISCWNPIFFGINEYNVYYRGKYFIIFALFNLMYLLISVVKVLYEIKRSTVAMKHDKRILLLYPLMPVVGAILQSSFYYGVNFTWVLTAMALQIIYFNFQNVLIMTDELTGLNNRRRFEVYLNSILNSGAKEDLFFIIMIDLDKFKQINDNLGHLTGDEALKDAAHIIVTSVRRKDFVARFAGDEFVVAGIAKNRAEVEELVANMNHNLSLFNSDSNKEFILSFSIGFAICDLKQSVTCFDKLIHEADDMMYSKKEKKAALNVLRVMGYSMKGVKYDVE